MKELAVYLRNKIIRFLYRVILKNVFFRIDPEKIHDQMVRVGEFLGRYAFTRMKTRLLFAYSNQCLEQEILGIKFKNPIGLAAGFDKNAQLTDILPAVGFGFAEVGSVTGEPCEGNPKPRLWRLKKSQGLVVYYGLKNDGAEKISERLRSKKFSIPIGTSIAKTNCQATVETEAGIADYLKAFEKFTEIGNYFTINISCPNAFGGQPFTDPGRLELLLLKIDAIQTKKPVFLKMSPDLTKDEIDGIVEVAGRHRVAGIICTNLTKNRDNPKILDEIVSKDGGISGKVVEDLATDLIRHVRSKAGDRFVIIGLGGVFSAEDAYKKIRAGASLIQLITGMIFEGPQVISEINQGLVRLLKKDGFKNISEAVGYEN